MIKFPIRLRTILSVLFLVPTIGLGIGHLLTKPQIENKTASKEIKGKEGVDEYGVPLHMHRRIAEGCSYKAEMVFYIADEVVYNGGTVEKMEKFMAENMSQAEFRIKIKLFKALHEWVSNVLEQQPEIRAAEQPVHEITWGFFQTCMRSSYEAMSIKPVAITNYYARAFGKILEVAEEGNIPIDS